MQTTTDETTKRCSLQGKGPMPVPWNSWTDRIESLVIRWAEEGTAPDFAIRMGIRRLLKRRLQVDVPVDVERRARLYRDRIEVLRTGPIALRTGDANDQHYEVPAPLFEAMLGPRLKYSSCYWDRSIQSLDAAEERMLALTCDRAKIKDGQSILELGCGWGSLSLWLAEHYPKSRIVSVSNSSSQADHIRAQCARKNVTNLEVVTADVAEFSPKGRFDRVLSVEMFEHLRNYAAILSRIAGWLEPGGYCFVHVFSHRNMVYFFEDESESDWMTRHFFSGGVMPSERIFFEFQKDLRVADHWRISGLHYSRTLEAWLVNLDRDRLAVRKILSDHYGQEGGRVWHTRWRIFLMACSELFRFRGGAEWGVSHTLLGKPTMSH